MVKRTWLSLLALVLILGINGAFLEFNAFRTFILADWGAMIDTAWRIVNGQKPYIDFLWTTGPVHLYLNAFFFKLLGFGKTAVLTHLILVSSAVIALTFFMVRRHAPLAVSSLASALTMTSFYWPISHPWYSATAHLWGIGAVVLFVLKASASPAFAASLLLGILASLSFFTKTNIGSAYLLVFFILLSLSPNRPRALGGYLLGILLTALGLSLFFSPALYLDQAITGYIFEGERPYKLTRLYREPWGWFIHPYGIPLLFLLPHARILLSRTRELLVLFLGILFVAVFSMRTSSLDDPANAHLMGVSIALAFLLIYRNRETIKASGRGAWVTISLAGLAVTAIALILHTAQVGLSLKSEFVNYGLNFKERNPIQAGLEGWLCPEPIRKPLDAMAAYIHRHVPGEESLLILTDMVILYPLTGRESRRGMPYYFAPYDFPLRGQIPAVRENITREPPDWILTDFRPPGYAFPGGKPLTGTGTRILAHLELRETVEKEYAPVHEWEGYVLLRRLRQGTRD